jgi:AraC family transcriptional regulator
MAKICGDLVPASGLKIADGPDFERYDGEFAPTRPGAVIDFYVPVEV